MEDLENTCLANLRYQPAFYYRYVDHILTTYDKDRLGELVHTFNNYDEHLRFTIEREQNFLELIKYNLFSLAYFFLFPVLQINWHRLALRN